MAPPAAAPVNGLRTPMRTSTHVHPNEMARCAVTPRTTDGRPSSVPAARVDSSTDRPDASAHTVDGTPLSTAAASHVRRIDDGR